MLRCTGAAGGLLAPLLMSISAPAQAQEQQALSSPRLDWHAPRDCPDTDSVSARLHEVVDGELLAFGHDWQISARVSADGAHAWRLVLELREPGTSSSSRQRVLRAARCDDLAEAAAVAIAIA